MCNTEEPLLSHEEVRALRQACNPIGVLAYPPIEAVMVLKQLDYVEIVFGGVQITPSGLKRLIRENERVRGEQHRPSAGRPPA